MRVWRNDSIVTLHLLLYQSTVLACWLCIRLWWALSPVLQLTFIWNLAATGIGVWTVTFVKIGLFGQEVVEKTRTTHRKVGYFRRNLPPKYMRCLDWRWIHTVVSARWWKPREIWRLISAFNKANVKIAKRSHVNPAPCSISPCFVGFNSVRLAFF